MKHGVVTTGPPEKSQGIVCAVGSAAQSCPTLWDPIGIAHEASLSMRISQQEYWSGLPLPTPGGLFDPGTEPVSCTGK